MRPFRVGDKFKGKHTEHVCAVICVDPNDHFRAVVDLEKATVSAAQFLAYWDLVEEGPAVAA